VNSPIPTLIVVALLAAIALCGVAIWAAIEVARTARSSRRLAENLDERVVPLTEKVDISVDALNAELMRVDIIVDQVEGVVGRFTETAESVREVVDAPIHLVTGVADRLRRGLRRHPKAEETASAEPREALVDVVVGEPGSIDSLGEWTDDEAWPAASEASEATEFGTDEFGTEEPGIEPDLAHDIERGDDAAEYHQVEPDEASQSVPEEA
jgi:hypothetical protein